MRMSEAFPSKYLAHNDVQNRPTVEIFGIQMEKMGDGEHKPVLYFINVPKGLVLNKTNATAVASLYGDESDHWRGKRVTLYVVDTMFGGQPTKGIRISPPDAGPQANTGATHTDSAMPGHMRDDPSDPGPIDPFADNPLGAG